MSWRKVKIGEFLFEREGRFKPDDKSLLSLDRLEKIDFSGKFYIGQKTSRTDMILIKSGDFVISGINVSKGAMGIYRKENDITATIHYSSYTFDESKIDINYFEHFLQSDEFIKLLEDQVKGGIKTEIKAKHLLKLEILLPSLQEQKQIAERLKYSEEKQKILQLQINNQKTNLKNLRKQILQDAIEGKLTKEWREQNPNIEPASELLKKIKQEKEKPLPPIEKNEVPFELPKGWVWTRLGEIIFYTENLDIQKRLNSNAKIAYIDIDSINNKEHRISNIKYKKVSELSSRARRVLKKGFLLYSTVRPYLENIAFIEDDIENYIGSTGFNVFKSIKADLNYIFYFLLTPNLNNKYKELMIGFNSPSITNTQFENTLIPLPPLSEQLAIVSKLQTSMQKLDEAEKQIEKSLETSKLLTKAILAEAFSFS